MRMNCIQSFVFFLANINQMNKGNQGIYYINSAYTTILYLLAYKIICSGSSRNFLK